MITWQATIKERGNDHVLTPSYSFAIDFFDYFKGEYEMREFLIGFWDLDNPDVEWYKLEKV